MTPKSGAMGVVSALANKTLSSTALCHRNPSLFSGLILLDPAINEQSITEAAAIPSIIRNTRTWESTKAAKTFITNSGEGKWWDTSVRERWIQYGIMTGDRVVFEDKLSTVGVKYVTETFARQPELYWGSVARDPSSTIIDHAPLKVLCIYGAHDPMAPVSEVSKRKPPKRNEKDKTKSKGTPSHVTNVLIPTANRFAPFVDPRRCGEAIACWIAEKILVRKEVDAKETEEKGH